MEMPDPLGQQSAPDPVEGGEPAPVEGLPVAPQEEYVPYRHGDFEAELPLSAVQTIAEKLGYENAAAVINQLRNGAEAQEISQQARKIYQQARQLRQSQQYAQPPQVEQRWENHLAGQRPQQQPQYRQPPADDIDPIALLSEMRQEMRGMSQYIQQQEARTAAEMQRNVFKLEREANREYEKFSGELKKQGIPEWRVPTMEYLLGEAEMMGLYHGEMPVGEMYRSIYKMMNSDYIAEAAAKTAVQTHVDRLRDPKARISVPVARPAPPQTAPAIDSMKIGDILPDGKY